MSSPISISAGYLVFSLLIVWTPIRSTFEINASFYRLQAPASYRSWYEQTPSGFRFAVKGSRFITHNKKLRDVDTPLANFFASGVLLLRDKLGPFVWQVSERLRFDAARLEHFVARLPRTTADAARLAERHDRRVDGRCSTEAGGRRRLRHAIEVRNESWLVPECVRILRRHDVAQGFATVAVVVGDQDGVGSLRRRHAASLTGPDPVPSAQTPGGTVSADSPYPPVSPLASRMPQQPLPRGRHPNHYTWGASGTEKRHDRRPARGADCQLRPALLSI